MLSASTTSVRPTFHLVLLLAIFLFEISGSSCFVVVYPQLHRLEPSSTTTKTTSLALSSSTTTTTKCLTLRFHRCHGLLSISSSSSGGDEDLPQQGDEDDNNDDNEDDNEDDNDDDEKPYRNRSLAWTRKYRKLVSYEYARRCAMDLGLRSKDEWDEYWEDGKAYHGPYLVSQPDLMYPDDWTSWEEFLGIMRPYHETQQLVRTLHLQTPDQYHDFVYANPKRAEGLRIPAQPHIVYRDKGWISWEDFLNKSLDRKETE